MLKGLIKNLIDKMNQNLFNVWIQFIKITAAVSYTFDISLLLCMQTLLFCVAFFTSSPLQGKEAEARTLRVLVIMKSRVI